MKKLSAWLSVLALCTFAAGNAQAQRFGGQVSWGSDSDIGVGARAEFDLTNTLSQQGPLSNAFIITQLDVYFPDCGGADCTWMEFNPSLAVPVPAGTLNAYLGAGLNIARISVDLGTFGNQSNTEIGINLLGGLKFPLGGLSAFSEARLSLGGGEQFAVSFGLLFGGSGQ